MQEASSSGGFPSESVDHRVSELVRSPRFTVSPFPCQRSSLALLAVFLGEPPPFCLIISNRLPRSPTAGNLPVAWG